jgi:outer membrane protein assembly factor BamD
MKKPYTTTYLFAPVLALMALSLLATGCATTGENGEGLTGTAYELYSEAVIDYQDADYIDAEAKLKTVLDNYPLSPQAREAQLLLGDLYYAREKYDDAVSYYTTFAGFYPSHPRAPYAMFQKGMSHFKGILTIDRDQTTTRKAIFSFRDLIAAYPESDYAERAGEMLEFLALRLAENEFYVAVFYEKNKNYESAIKRFGFILRDYPEAGISDKVLFHIAVSYLELGEETLARDTFETLVREYPESPFTEELKDRYQA